MNALDVCNRWKNCSELFIIYICLAKKHNMDTVTAAHSRICILEFICFFHLFLIWNVFLLAGKAFWQVSPRVNQRTMLFSCRYCGKPLAWSSWCTLKFHVLVSSIINMHRNFDLCSPNALSCVILANFLY